MRIPKFNIPSAMRHLPEAFSISGFRSVAAKLAKQGARKVLTSALTLYYCMRDGDTPAWAKSVIVGALGYLVFPMDFIPDAILGAGFTDDWSVILGAIATVASHIKGEHWRMAEAQATRIFGGESSIEGKEA